MSLFSMAVVPRSLEVRTPLLTLLTFSRAPLLDEVTSLPALLLLLLLPTAVF